MTDNFMVDTQEETRFDMDDTKHYAYQKQKSKDISQEHLKKNNKFFKYN